MTTTNSAVKEGDRVVSARNGKQYQISHTPWIDDAPRNAVDYTGQLVTYAQPINQKTGKAWQASKLFLVSELELI